MIAFKPKLTGATVLETADFISDLAIGETLTGVPTVTASVWAGTDASPSSIVDGAASISGTIVSQKLTGGVAGVIYKLLWSVGTSLGQTLNREGLFAVVADEL